MNMKCQMTCTSMRGKKKRGFTLIEIMAVVSILGILLTLSVITYNQAWKNNQIDIAESELREMASAFSGYIIDYGNITAADDMNFETVIEETVDLLNRQYLANEIKIEEVAADRRSVRLRTKTKADPWKHNYEINIYTYDGEERESISGLVVIASYGIDGTSQRANYHNDNYGDDIIAIVEPK